MGLSTPQPGENLARLYEMSDSPERRAWLDKLLAFMEDNKTPITACPTISKNPLDLYALYLHVRERGGFVEVGIELTLVALCRSGWRRWVKKHCVFGVEGT